MLALHKLEKLATIKNKLTCKTVLSGSKLKFCFFPVKVFTKICIAKNIGKL